MFVTVTHRLAFFSLRRSCMTLSIFAVLLLPPSDRIKASLYSWSTVSSLNPTPSLEKDKVKMRLVLKQGL